MNKNSKQLLIDEMKRWQKARLDQLVEEGILCKPVEIRMGFARNVMISPSRIRENQLQVSLSDITSQLSILKKTKIREVLTEFEPSDLEKEILRVKSNLIKCGEPRISGIPVFEKEEVKTLSWSTYIYSFFFKVE